MCHVIYIVLPFYVIYVTNEKLQMIMAFLTKLMCTYVGIIKTFMTLVFHEYELYENKVVSTIIDKSEQYSIFELLKVQCTAFRVQNIVENEPQTIYYEPSLNDSLKLF